MVCVAILLATLGFVAVFDIKREGDLFTMTTSEYEDSAYERLEESVQEYLDDSEFIDKLVPHLKKAILKNREERKEAYDRVDSIVKSLFPEEELEIKKPVVLG